jgi:hypothetical protein
MVGEPVDIDAEVGERRDRHGGQRKNERALQHAEILQAKKTGVRPRFSVNARRPSWP